MTSLNHFEYNYSFNFNIYNVNRLNKEINIVSGNNSSIQGEPTGTQIKGGSSSTQQTIDKQSEIIGGSLPKTEPKPAVEEMKREEKSNSIFDFTKSFFIKKNTAT